jgi:phosphoglucomutase
LKNLNVDSSLRREKKKKKQQTNKQTNKQATLFDFEAIRKLFLSGFRMRFDAMHAVTGPYAKRVFVS